MLVRDGPVVMREAHRARIDASARELYGLEATVAAGWDAQLQDALAQRALPRGARLRRPWSGRLRMTFVPGHGLSFDARARGRDPAYTAVAPFELPGGLGCHKWADRRLVDALAAAAGDALALLVDADGAVLETTWSSVLIEEHGRLISPPQDGRALPGIGRRRLRYDEEPVDLDRLLAADAVVLTSALRVVRLAQR